MFRLVESRSDISACQRQLEHLIRGHLRTRTKRNIGYPSDTLFGATVWTDSEHWYHSRDQRDEGTPRRLNWFGLFRAKHNLQITVEINVPFEGRNDQTAGFFIRDPRTNRTFLAHSGRVGGGTAGVGKTGLLTWSDLRLIEAEDQRGGIREGVLVAPLAAKSDGVASLMRYVDTIARYKLAVRAGETKTAAFRQKAKRYADYYEEARGRRRGRRAAEIDYVTRHGDIVSALHAWRESRPLPRKSRLVKDILIDLGVEVGDTLVELYEAKSGTDRSSIYGAIGQLLVHGHDTGCERFVALPDGEPLAPDLAAALRRLEIRVMRYTLDKKAASIVEA